MAASQIKLSPTRYKKICSEALKALKALKAFNKRERLCNEVFVFKVKARLTNFCHMYDNHDSCDKVEVTHREFVIRNVTC